MHMSRYHQSYGVLGRERYQAYAEMNPSRDKPPLTITMRLKEIINNHATINVLGFFYRDMDNVLCCYIQEAPLEFAITSFIAGEFSRE